MKTLALVLFALFSATAQSAPVNLPDEDESRELCERMLMSNLHNWKKQALANLAQISTFPVYAVEVSPRAENLIAQALNVKPAQVPLLPAHEIKVAREGDRLQLELQDWPNFHRTLISLRQPEVIKDLTLSTFAPNFETAVQVNTFLFYPIRELPHETELGLVLPMRKLTDGEPGQPPYFDFQIALLKPCFEDEEQNTQIFTGEAGESLCVDPLVRLSTWRETFEFYVDTKN